MTVFYCMYVSIYVFYRHVFHFKIYSVFLQWTVSWHTPDIVKKETQIDLRSPRSWWSHTCSWHLTFSLLSTSFSIVPRWLFTNGHWPVINLAAPLLFSRPDTIHPCPGTCAARGTARHRRGVDVINLAQYWLFTLNPSAPNIAVPS